MNAKRKLLKMKIKQEPAESMGTVNNIKVENTESLKKPKIFGINEPAFIATPFVFFVVPAIPHSERRHNLYQKMSNSKRIFLTFLKADGMKEMQIEKTSQGVMKKANNIVVKYNELQHLKDPFIQRRIKEEEDDKKKPKKLKTEKLECSSSKVKLESDYAWTDFELLAEAQNLSKRVAQVTIKLFDEGNTIPFIARYRKDMTENLTPEQLRDIKEEYDKINALKIKTEQVLKTVEKSGHLSPSLERAILSARTSEELEHIYAPYKPGTKRTLAERAKSLGLEKPALDLLNGVGRINFENYVNKQKEGLKDVADIEKGVVHIIAAIIATNKDTLGFLRKLRSETNFTIETKKSNARKQSTTSTLKTNKQRDKEETKFETYFDFHSTLKFIKPHQVLAINRGESLKILSVKIVMPDFVFNRFSNFCSITWTNVGKFDNARKQVLCAAIKDSYTRLVQPYIIREVRSELKIKAEKASYEVFSSNLKQLLLTPPVKGQPILGIDPGFSNGCKLAIISETGSMLSDAIIYPHRKKSDKDIKTLKNMLRTHNLIALGNGTACRETEAWLSELIQNNIFKPLDVKYTIINESGASIYSCSPEAKKEFPNLDPNIVSAVSLARRLQDPLAELVKVEPKHLGVGMYQHDLPKKQLQQALDEVITECVSFVGVDLNTTSQCLLRKVAGLNDKRSTQIIEHRMKKGPFLSRKQLLDVTSIGPKVFQQCSGFLRVGPNSTDSLREFYKNPIANRLDCTYIHPESYEVTVKLIKKLKLNIDHIGQQEFIEAIKTQMICLNKEELGKSFGASIETINLILDALSKPLNFDLRSNSLQQPVFKKGVVSIADLKIGDIVTGNVNNVTHFGCFVDIGVGTNGLIHQSKLRGFNLKIGDRVSVKVLNIEAARNRMNLEMISQV